MKSAGLFLILSISLFAQDGSVFSSLTDQDLDRGKRLFEGQCAACHGMDGTGGRGPSLARPKLKHAAEDDELIELISKGIPNSEMPGVWQMTPREIVQVGFYVRSIGRHKAFTVNGNPAKGHSVYENRGGCSGCHIVRGAGGSLGPELTDVGARRSPGYLREKLTHPSRQLPEGFLMVRAKLQNETEVRGIRVNEDTFTIQIRDLQGRLHSFDKTKLKDLVKEPATSPMPSFASRLQPDELDDLIAYLVSLQGET